MATTVGEKRAYSRGYMAGVARTKREAAIAQHDELRKRAYLAIAPAIIMSSWDRKPGSDPSSAQTKMYCVDAFVDEFMKRF